MADRYAYNPFIVDDDDDSDSDDSCIVIDDAPMSSDDDETTSSSSSSADSSSSSESDDSSDPDFAPTQHRERLRCGLVVARPADVDDHRFRHHLLRQHTLRTPDHALCAGTDRPVTLHRWRSWRKSFLSGFALKRFPILEDVVVSRVTGVTGAGAAAGGAPMTRKQRITVYRSLCAVMMNPGLLLQMFFAHIDPIPASVPLMVCADAVGRLAGKCPADGKVSGFYFKPITTIKPQSPSWLLPWFFAFGPDSAGVLHRVFAEANTRVVLDAIQRRRYGRPPAALASIVLAFLGDYPACYATLRLSTPARAFPTTAGRVRLWESVLCWHCGAGGCEIYNTNAGHAWRCCPRDDHVARIVTIESALGIPAIRVFYDPVHSACVVVQSVLCDMAIYFQRVHSDYLHPAAAFIFALFGSDVWDPFLVTVAASDQKKRRSSKPFYAVDPAVIMSFVTDSDQIQKLLGILARYDVPWRVPCMPEGPASPLALFLAVLHWLDAFIAGNAPECRNHGARAEDMWRHMLSLSAPVPADKPCALDQRPSFLPSITAYGPASHTAFCSSWRYIEHVNRTVPAWRDSGCSFFKVASSVFLEHGMKTCRQDYVDFGVAGRARPLQPLELLERKVEQFMLRTVLDFKGYKHARAEGGHPANRAYKDIPLSRRIPFPAPPK